MAVSLANHSSLNGHPDAIVLEIISATTKAQSDVLSTPHEGPPASFGVEVGISIMIGVMWIWSGAGNMVTILAITKNRHMRTKCNFFILSLAFSDLLSGVIASPLWLYRRIWGFEEWLWSDFLCKLYWFVDESTSYCTAMHIASFGVWRYIGVRCPHSVNKISKGNIKLWILTIWTIAVIFGGCIFSTFYAVRDGSHAEHLGEDYAQWPSCSVKIPDNGVQKQKLYYTISSTTFMILPMFILFISSLLIGRELFHHRKTRNEFRRSKERKAVCQLGLISASFLFGYVPMTTYVMWTTRSPHSNEKLDYWTHVVSYFALRISECLNPIIYNIASENMRNASNKIIADIRDTLQDVCRTDHEIELAKRNLSRKAPSGKTNKKPSKSSSGYRTPRYEFPPKPRPNMTHLLQKPPENNDAVLELANGSKRNQNGADEFEIRRLYTVKANEVECGGCSRSDDKKITSL